MESTGQTLLVLHVNHGVRGPPAAEDARFVKDLTRELGLPFRELAADPSKLQKDGRASEGRLREARYTLLNQALTECGGQALFTAHTLDDRVESILLAALRGAGLKGLRGMQRRRRLRPGGPWLVRPYIEQRAAWIRNDLRSRSRTFREDDTNRDLTYRRNQIRHQFLPWLRGAFGPHLDRRILRLGRLSRLLWRRARTEARALDRGSSADAMHAALEAAAGRDLSRGLSLSMQRLLRQGGHGMVPLGTGRALRIGPDARLTPIRTVTEERPAPQIELRVLTDDQGRLHRLLLRLDRGLLRGKLERRGRIYLDADRVHFPLCVRGRQPGDRFQPLGWQVPGKLKNQLIARKLPRSRREQLVLFESREGLCAVESLPPGIQSAITARTRRLLRITITRAGD